MPQPTNRFQRINVILTEAFAPTHLDVVDDSARHVGHAGASPDGETHYNVTIISLAFIGLSRVQIQRAVMKALQPEFDTGLHALSLKATPPSA